MEPMKFLGQHHASVEDLPNEVLTKIFYIVHEGFVTQFHEPPKDDPYDKKWFLRPELSSPRFPNTLAEVSSRWQSIITAIPDFWATLVLIIDTLKLSSYDLQAYLKRSRNLPLNIFVTRHSRSHTPTSEEETSLLSPLVALLTPHFPRCFSISFYAIHSSALPKLGHDISGKFPNLVELRLEYEIDDGGSYPIPTWQSVTCPILGKLVIDGHKFANMTSMNGLWPLQFPRLKSLSIVHLSPNSGDDATGRRPISLYDFLEVLVGESFHLDYLRLCDAELTSSYSEEFPVILTLNKALVLEDLSRSVAHKLMLCLKPHSPELYVSRCSLNSMGLHMTATLQLEDIGVFDRLPMFLDTWSGSTLTLVRCHGLDDNFFDMLGRPSTYTGAPNLIRLSIVNCPNFTVGALKKMVESRNKVKKGAGWPGRPAIEDLIITGKGPALETTSATWLRDRLKSLEWTTAES